MFLSEEVKCIIRDNYRGYPTTRCLCFCYLIYCQTIIDIITKTNFVICVNIIFTLNRRILYCQHVFLTMHMRCPKNILVVDLYFEFVVQDSNVLVYFIFSYTCRFDVGLMSNSYSLIQYRHHIRIDECLSSA